MSRIQSLGRIEDDRALQDVARRWRTRLLDRIEGVPGVPPVPIGRGPARIDPIARIGPSLRIDRIARTPPSTGRRT
jgi:hypothetical protein